MTAIDSSVAVAAPSSWHERHEPARVVVAGGASIPAHAALETYSVLTRLPAPIQVPGAVAGELLAGAFRGHVLTCAARSQRRLVTRLADLDIAGGAVYDALIGLTALEAGEALVTLDTRALVTYARCGVDARLLAG